MQREQEFDLDLGGAPAGTVRGAAPASADRTRRQGRGRSRGPAPWIGLGTLLVLAGIAAAPDPPGEQIGIIDRVGEPQQQWQVQQDVGSIDAPAGLATNEAPPLWLTEEAVIRVGQGRIQSLSVEDGATLWTMEGMNLSCHLEDPVILCASGFQSGAELIRLHTTDGETSRTSSPGLLAAQPIGDDVVTVRDQGNGTVATRKGPDGEEAWSTLIDASDLWSDGRYVTTTIDQVADSLLIGIQTRGEFVSTLLEPRTGREEGTQDAVLFRHPWSLTEDWLAVRPGNEVHRVGDTGDLDPSYVPTEGLLHVDDDATSATSFLTDENDLVAVSREGEGELWRTERLGGAVPVARLGEVLLAHQATHLIGVDLATGERLWNQISAQIRYAFSDGDVLVLLSSSTDDVQAVGDVGPTITILGMEPRTGEHLFDLSFPGQSIYHHALAEDGLVLLTDAGLSLWRW